MAVSLMDNDIEENMDNNSYNDLDNEKNYSKSPAGKLIIAAAIIVFLLAVGGIIPFIFAKNMVSDAIKQDTTQYNVSVTAVIKENIVREADGGADEDTRTEKVYTPVYEYEYHGKTYSVHGSVASANKKYEVGDKVDVLISDVNPGKMYDPEYNPAKVIKDFGHGISGTLILVLVFPIILVVVMVTVVIIVVVRSSKRKKAQQVDDDYRG
ncbi:MAG: DUF3592 domain-containing protein [Ruminococcus sp.]|nr:DUF3592 domain-containing protein [Ruminococcus sp.]